MSNIRVRQIRFNRQAGMVSILVTMILMIVISLIVLGFAQVSRRNQRQTLDRQLSTQAFYAAETGVNDVRDILGDALSAGTTVYAKSTCGLPSGAAGAQYARLSSDAQISSDGSVKYTCVMVDPAPKTLVFGDVGTTSIVVPAISGSGNPLTTLKLVWHTKDDTTTPTNNCPNTTNNVFSTVSNWQCGYGVLRVDMVPTNGTFNASDLQNRTMTSFMVPQRPGSPGAVSSVGFSTGGANNRPGVACTNANCTMTITGLSSNQYYLRISSTYKNAANLQISATDASGAVGLSGAQAVIDSTGRAQDVLRRIQVHVPLTPSSQNQLSDYAIQSTDSICKRFVVMGGLFNSVVSGVSSTNPLCQP